MTDFEEVDEGPELCNCDVCECVNREYMAGAGLCGCCAADCPDVHPETGGSLLAGRVLSNERLGIKPYTTNQAPTVM